MKKERMVSNNQKAGDNSQQFQAGTVIVYNGITEECARSICQELSQKAFDEYATIAQNVANERLIQFENSLLARIEKVESGLEAFADPAFHIAVRKAQVEAISTDRELDYTLLSELLAHRVTNMKDRKKITAISKAIEVVNKVDDDALCAITAMFAFLICMPYSSSMLEGIHDLEKLLSNFVSDLPQNDEWIDHLYLLNIIRPLKITRQKSFEEIIENKLQDYLALGIEKDTDEYLKCVELLHSIGFSKRVLVENDFDKNYVKLPLGSTGSFDGITKTGHDINVAIPLSSEEIEVLERIKELYTKDDVKLSALKEFFENVLSESKSIMKMKEWWNAIPVGIEITYVGGLLSVTNARIVCGDFPYISDY